MVAFDVFGAVSKIKAVIKSRHSKILALEDLIQMVEASMERMLLMALWVNSQVSAIVDSSAKGSPLVLKSIAELKRPIVLHLISQRAALHSATGFVPTRIQSAEGYWPPGLRADT